MAHRLNLLIAKQQHAVTRQGLVLLAMRVIAQRLSQVDTVDLRADVLRDRFNRDGSRCHGRHFTRQVMLDPLTAKSGFILRARYIIMQYSE